MKKYTLSLFVVMLSLFQISFAQEKGSSTYLREALEIQLKDRLQPHPGIIPHKGPFYVVIDESYDLKKLDLDSFKDHNIVYLTREELEKKPRNEIGGYYKISPIYLKGDRVVFYIIEFVSSIKKQGVKFLIGGGSKFQLLNNCGNTEGNFKLKFIKFS
ncbi:MAG: hypothetical protein ABJI69_01735 [Balneola sp.]